MALRADIVKKLKHYTLDVSLSCERGKVLSLVGPSGAGKTTILRIIAGLDRPDKGVVESRNRIWTDMGKKITLPTQKRRLGMVFQDFSLFPHCSILKNICFTTSDRAMAEGLMKRFGIWHLRDSRPQAVSGGERQRAAICQALAREPEVLLMDEPFSALDALNRRNLREMVKSMKQELDIPIIHVTHDIREALFLGDDILPVVRGRVENKWLLQFMIMDRDISRMRCADHRAGRPGDEEEEIDLTIPKREYMR